MFEGGDIDDLQVRTISEWMQGLVVFVVMFLIAGCSLILFL